MSGTLNIYTTAYLLLFAITGKHNVYYIPGERERKNDYLSSDVPNDDWSNCVGRSTYWRNVANGNVTTSATSGSDWLSASQFVAVVKTPQHSTDTGEWGPIGY